MQLQKNCQMIIMNTEISYNSIIFLPEQNSIIERINYSWLNYAVTPSFRRETWQVRCTSERKWATRDNCSLLPLLRTTRQIPYGIRSTPHMSETFFFPFHFTFKLIINYIISYPLTITHTHSHSHGCFPSQLPLFAPLPTLSLSPPQGLFCHSAWKLLIP